MTAMPTRLLAAAVMAAAGIAGAAATANADPLSDPNMNCFSTLWNVYCDGPVQPDGTWSRSWTTTGGSYYAGPGQMGFIPGQTHYQRIDPTEPWPAIPFGAPQHHIDVTGGGL